MKRALLVCLALGAVCSLFSPAPVVFATEGEGIEALIFQNIPNVVTPGRREMSIKESPNAISVITRSEIRFSPCRTIPELLQYVVGMDGYTKTHTDMDVIARGQTFDESPEMLVMIDGQPVNVAPYSGLQWPTVPIALEDIDRIEIVRGPASAAYGADALLGVINILTIPVKDRKNSIKTMIGELGTQEVGVHAAQMLSDKLGIALTLNYVQTQGKGMAETEAAKQFIPNWDIKDWANIAMLGYRLDYQEDAVKVLSETSFSSDEEGYNPSPGDPAIDRSRKQTLISSNKVTVPLDIDEITLNAGVRNLWQLNHKWAGSEYAYKYTIYPGMGIDSTLQYLLRRVPFNTIAVGINYSYLNAGREIQNPIPYQYNQVDRLVGGFLQDQVSLLEDTLFLTLGARYDKWSSLDGVFTPLLGANYLMLDKTLTFRALAGTSFHRPDFDSQYYYVDLSGISPNSWFKGTQLSLTTADGRLIEGTNLKPSTNTSYEVGVRYDPDPDLSANLGFFSETIKDMSSLYSIYANFDPAAGPVGLNLSYQNSKGRVEIRGLEFEASKTFENLFKVWGNWTGQVGWNIAEDGTRTDWLAMPKTKLAAGVVVTGPINVDIRGRFVSDVYFNEIGAPANKVSAYRTIDVSAFKEFGPLMVKLAVLNLFNDVHYEYPLYTQLVRKAMLTAQYSF